MAVFSDRLRELLNGAYSDRVPYLKKQLEHKSCLSSEDIAKVIGTSKQTVANWINGTSPKADFLVELAKAYKVSVDWLVGLSDAESIEQQEQYAPFKELGFSYKAYENLIKLKEQGENLSALMQGINYILEQSDIDDIPGDYEPETNTLPIVGHSLSLPIVDALNRFFYLYPHGVENRITVNALKTLVNQLGEDNSCLDLDSLNAFLVDNCDIELPQEGDTVSLNMLENHLKRCKGRLVAEELKRFNEDDEDALDLTAQIGALKLLDKYYNS